MPLHTGPTQELLQGILFRVNVDEEKKPHFSLLLQSLLTLTGNSISTFPVSLVQGDFISQDQKRHKGAEAMMGENMHDLSVQGPQVSNSPNLTGLRILPGCWTFSGKFTCVLSKLEGLVPRGPQHNGSGENIKYCTSSLPGVASSSIRRKPLLMIFIQSSVLNRRFRDKPRGP